MKMNVYEDLIKKGRVLCVVLGIVLNFASLALCHETFCEIISSLYAYLFAFIIYIAWRSVAKRFAQLLQPLVDRENQIRDLDGHYR